MEHRSHDVFKSSYLDDFDDFAKTLKKPAVRVHVFCLALQLSLWWRIIQSLTEKKEVENDVEDEEVKKKEEQVSKVDLTSLFYTGMHGDYQQKPWSVRLKHTIVVEQAVHFWSKEPSFSDAIDNVDYDAPGEVTSTHPG